MNMTLDLAIAQLPMVVRKYLFRVQAATVSSLKKDVLLMLTQYAFIGTGQNKLVGLSNSIKYVIVLSYLPTTYSLKPSIFSLFWGYNSILALMQL